MKKIFKNPMIQDHVIPTLIVVSWFSILLIVALVYAK
tara:strand:+ start:988 stop:1098 length:111 start_codon:yes stop_codon:yes gene_type:complete